MKRGHGTKKLIFVCHSKDNQASPESLQKMGCLNFVLGEENFQKLVSLVALDRRRYRLVNSSGLMHKDPDLKIVQDTPGTLGTSHFSFFRAA